MKNESRVLKGSSNDSCPRVQSWKWLAGGAGAFGAAAVAPGLNAAIVQINQTDNEVKLEAGTFSETLDPDYTQDGSDDARDLAGIRQALVGGAQDVVRLDISYTYMRVGFSTGVGGFVFAKPPTQSNQPTVPFTRNLLIPVEFSDSRINGGVTTNGFMHVKAFHTNFNTFAIQLLRLIFDDANTAAPGASVGTDYTVWQEFVTPPPTTQIDRSNDIVLILIDIKKTKKKIKKAKKSGKKAKLKKLKKQLKALKRRL